MTARRLAFGGFRLDASRRLLFAADGATVPLNSRAFDTLLCLLERPGELLDKATLLRAVWPNTIVEENNLNQCIWALRRALGETPGEHRFIVTVPGRGYRFVAPVVDSDDEALDSGGAEPIAESPPPSPSPDPGATTAELRAAEAALPRHHGPVSWPTRLLTVLAVIVLAAVVGLVARRPAAETGTTRALIPVRDASIAVLPFADMSAGRDQEPFADGLSEELLLHLGRRSGLRTISRTSSFAFKGRNEDLRRIGRQLGADYVLEGSVRSDGGRVRVTAQLVDSATGTRVWSEVYDRRNGNAIVLQDELASAIATGLAEPLLERR